MSAAANEIILDASTPAKAAKAEPAKLVAVPKPAASMQPVFVKWTMLILPPVLGVLLFIGVWALIAGSNPNLPGPGKTWVSAVQVFSDPFYQKGPNDQGIGWNILASLKRVGIHRASSYHFCRTSWLGNRASASMPARPRVSRRLLTWS